MSLGGFGDKFCRLCLSENEVFIPIFYRGSELPSHISSCLDIQVSERDCASKICINCNGNLRHWWNFKLEIVGAQKALNTHLSRAVKATNPTADNEPNRDSAYKHPERQNASSLQVQECHSIGVNDFNSSRIFIDSVDNCVKNGATALVIKQEKSDRNDYEANQTQIQFIPVSASLASSLNFSQSQQQVSSSSGVFLNYGSDSSTSIQQNSFSNERTASSAAKEIINESGNISFVSNQQKRRRSKTSNGSVVKRKRAKISNASLKKGDSSKIFTESQKALTPSKNKLASKMKCSQVNRESASTNQAGLDIKCRYCVLTFKTDADYRKHLKYHTAIQNNANTRVACPQCSNLVQLKCLKTHIKRVHKLNPDSVKTVIEGKKIKVFQVGMKLVLFSCNLCKNSYKTVFALKMHKKRFHSNVNDSNGNESIKRSLTKSRCDHCFRQLISFVNLQNHKKYCGTARALICSVCGYQFENERRLRRHLKERHKIADVDKEIREILELKETKEVKEVKETKEQSKISTDPSVAAIRKRFSTLKKCRSNYLAKFSCEQCQRQFQSAAQLKQHVSYCSSSDAFQCNYCPHRFDTVRSLTNHESFHSKKYYECDICSAYFPSVSTCLEHRKKHKKPLGNFNPQPIILGGKIGAAKLLHKCRGCQSIFYKSTDFMNHKPNCSKSFLLKCNKCFCRFSYKKCLDKHVVDCKGKPCIEEKLKLTNKDIKCFKCKHSFSKEVDFMDHFKECHNGFSIYTGNTNDCHYCFWATKHAAWVKKHERFCKGLPFQVVNSSLNKGDKPSFASVEEGSSGDPDKKFSISKGESGDSSPFNADVSSSANIEVEQICSTNFMNEHLNASKSAQVVVQKLSSDEISHAIKKEEDAPSKDSRVKKDAAQQQASTPHKKPGRKPGDHNIKCPTCPRFFTFYGFRQHRCHPNKKKKRSKPARMGGKKRRKYGTGNKTESLSYERMVRCEICHQLFNIKVLPRHLKHTHLAINPGDMARSMYENSINKIRIDLNESVIKQEYLPNSKAYDSNHENEVEENDEIEVENAMDDFDENEIENNDENELGNNDENELGNNDENELGNNDENELENNNDSDAKDTHENGGEANDEFEIENEVDDDEAEVDYSDEVQLENDLDYGAEMTDDIEIGEEVNNECDGENEDPADNHELNEDEENNSAEDDNHSSISLNKINEDHVDCGNSSEANQTNVDEGDHMKENARPTEKNLNDVNNAENTVDSDEESLEGILNIRCDLCNVLFSVLELEKHLKLVHNAINPVEMAQSMLETNLSLLRYGFSGIKSEPQSDCEEDYEDESASLLMVKPSQVIPPENIAQPLLKEAFELGSNSINHES